MRAFLAGLLLLVAVAVFHEPLLGGLGRYLVATDQPAVSDAIVMLSGSVPDRILGAVDLYKQGYAPLLILTRDGGMPGLAELRKRGVEIPESYETNLTIAVRLGVPREAIVILEQRNTSTIGEITDLLVELRRRGVHSLVLVTSKSHARRAKAIFDVLAQGEFEMRVYATPYDPFPPDSWWHERRMARRLVIEYGKWLMFQLVDRWRPRP